MRNLYTFLGRNTHKTNETVRSFGSNFGKGLILMLFFIIHSFGSFSQKSFDQQDNLISQGRTELVAKRDAFSKTYIKKDGGFQKVQSIVPIHYQNSKGEWIEYSSDLVNSGSIYTFKSTDVPISINTNSAEVKMDLDNENSISFGKHLTIGHLNNEGKQISTKKV